MINRNQQQIRGSLGQNSWRRFRKNPFAMSGLILILLAALLSLLGYLITPDSTPFANHQQLEVATQPPGFSVHMLYIQKNHDTGQTSLLHRMLFGHPSAYTTIPLQQWDVEGEYLIYEVFSGQQGYPGREGSIHLADVLFALHTEESGLLLALDSIQFMAVDGQHHSHSLEQMQQDVLQNHIRKKKFLLGTDRFGRDMLSQLVIGTRVSLSVGFIAVLISLIIGISLGSLAGYYRGRLDDFIVWLINVVWSIPTLLLVIAITFALGKGFWQVFIAVGLTMWVEVARLVRGQVISAREKEYVEAARALGLSSIRIIRKHILPNIMGPVIVLSAANFASAILIEAGLSFLGIGVQPPMPSWGSMIREHYGYIILDKAYLAILPGLCIMMMVLSFMLAGNGLRESLDNTEQH
jgi:peptide/nickel transport system permease protein